jgi:hypothetical protein
LAAIVAANKAQAVGAGSAPWPAPFTSQTLPIFIDRLSRIRDSRALDAGPVCGINISFFASHLARLYICDLFQHLGRAQGPLSRGDLWRPLEYPPQHFHGLLLWDLIDRLNDDQFRELIDICHSLLVPQGLVSMFGLPEGSSPAIQSFAIGPDYHVSPRPQKHLNLPFLFRQSRALERFMIGFRPVKSFVLKNGLREFLFERI